MSRGRSHHQASRRRAYSTRQREARERSMPLTGDGAAWSTDGWTSVETDERAEQRVPAGWALRTSGRAGGA